jgi:hypothetical protein
LPSAPPPCHEIPAETRPRFIHQGRPKAGVELARGIPPNRPQPHLRQNPYGGSFVRAKSKFRPAKSTEQISLSAFSLSPGAVESAAFVF